MQGVSKLCAINDRAASGLQYETKRTGLELLPPSSGLRMIRMWIVYIGLGGSGHETRRGDEANK